jgi:sulfate permease, SulP family
LAALRVWVTAAPIHDVVLSKVEAAPPGTRAVVLDLEATNQMDPTSADALADLLAELRERGVDLYLVRIMWPVRKVLRRRKAARRQLGARPLGELA